MGRHRRSRRGSENPSRNARVADQVRRNLRELPTALALRVSGLQPFATSSSLLMAIRARQNPLVRVSRLRENVARVGRREGMRSQLHLGQGTRDPQQVHWCQRKVCPRPLRTGASSQALHPVLRRIRLYRSQAVRPGDLFSCARYITYLTLGCGLTGAEVTIRPVSRIVLSTRC